ncbi:MAG: hypothetical protein EZS28_014725 [Streblomastix strix]|uniref:Uncharacterized protein n=1 Tax=Streblomastix strix TaxID=222440 RepID=A0A5J4W560_9EUKA|nr:MAG: hypothetical protein EZS28_014725 [Streblomastix strix]
MLIMWINYEELGWIVQNHVFSKSKATTLPSSSSSSSLNASFEQKVSIHAIINYVNVLHELVKCDTRQWDQNETENLLDSLHYVLGIIGNNQKEEKQEDQENKFDQKVQIEDEVEENFDSVKQNIVNLLILLNSKGFKQGRKEKEKEKKEQNDRLNLIEEEKRNLEQRLNEQQQQIRELEQQRREADERAQQSEQRSNESIQRAEQAEQERNRSNEQKTEIQERMNKSEEEKRIALIQQQNSEQRFRETEQRLNQEKQQLEQRLNTEKNNLEQRLNTEKQTLEQRLNTEKNQALNNKNIADERTRVAEAAKDQKEKEKNQINKEKQILQQRVNLAEQKVRDLEQSLDVQKRNYEQKLKSSEDQRTKVEKERNDQIEKLRIEQQQKIKINEEKSNVEKEKKDLDDQLNSVKEENLELKNTCKICCQIGNELIQADNEAIRKKKEELIDIIVISLNEAEILDVDRMIGTGIVQGFLHIFINFPFSLIKRSYTQSFFKFTLKVNNSTQWRLFSTHPYPALLRLLSHTNSEIAGDAIGSIFNILLFSLQIPKSTGLHDDFDIIQECDGINKIFALFKRNASKYSRDRAALCISMLFKNHEINDYTMRLQIISHLKSLVYDTDEWMKNASRGRLKGLSENPTNKAEIEKGGFVIPA